MKDIVINDFNDWKTGDLNSFGKKIKHIYHLRKDHYIIYTSVSSSLVSHKSAKNSDYSEKMIKIEKELSKIKGLLSKFNSKIFINRIASAIKCCFEDDIEQSKEILDEVLASIRSYKTKLGKIYYLLSAIGFGIITTLSIHLIKFHIYPLLFKSICFGILGGIFSILIKLNDINIDIDSDSTFIHICTGITRILISIIASIVVYHLLKSEIILGNIKYIQDNREHMYYIIAFISGFSEMLVPNILTSVEKSIINNENGDVTST